MELSSADVLGLMVAARSDEATTARLQQLQEELAKIEAAKADNEKLAAACARDRNEAMRLAAASETRHQNAAAKERACDKRERDLADVLASMNAEKKAWGDVRQKVDREQAERKDQLEALAAMLTNREMAVGERVKFVAARELASSEAQGKYEGLLARARLLLDLEKPLAAPERPLAPARPAMPTKQAEPGKAAKQ